MMVYKPYPQVEAERRAFILAKKPLVPKGRCNFCDYEVPKLALWCSSECAQEFDGERQMLLKTA